MKARDYFETLKEQDARSQIRNSQQVREAIREHLDASQRIIDQAEDEGREVTAIEESRINRHMELVGNDSHTMGGAATGLFAELASVQEREEALQRRVLLQTNAQSAGTVFEDLQTGRTIYALAPEQKAAAIYQSPGRNFGEEQPRIGNLIRCMLTGDWSRSSAEFHALSEGSNAGGGYLVPAWLSAQILDAARAKSVLIRAGAVTIPMESETLRIARVKTDPTFELKAENAKFTATEPTFDDILLTSRTLGTVVSASRELAEDAPNFASLIEGILANAFAAELDRQGLQGSSSAELSGLIGDAACGSTAAVGAIAWEDLATAVVDVWSNNFEPNAYVCSPTIAGDLDGLTSGDGSTSAKLWLTAPPNVSPLTRFVTTNCPDENLIIGDFSQLAFGVRMRPRIEISTEGDEAFSRHQVLIKLTWRGDVARLRADAFHILAGISS